MGHFIEHLPESIAGFVYGLRAQTRSTLSKRSAPMWLPRLLRLSSHKSPSRGHTHIDADPQPRRSSRVRSSCCGRRLARADV